MLSASSNFSVGALQHPSCVFNAIGSILAASLLELVCLHSMPLSVSSGRVAVQEILAGLGGCTPVPPAVFCLFDLTIASTTRSQFEGLPRIYILLAVRTALNSMWSGSQKVSMAHCPQDNVRNCLLAAFTLQLLCDRLSHTPEFCY